MCIAKNPIILCSLILISLCAAQPKLPEKRSITDLLDLKDLSDTCLTQLNSLPDDTKLKMFDASTKIPTGVWAGNFFDLGNFDECYGLENETPNGTVYGKYCLGTVPVPFDIDINSFGDKQPNRFSSVFKKGHHPDPRLFQVAYLAGYHWALCIPSGCTTEELNSLGLIFYVDSLCSSEATEPELTVGAKITIAFLSIMLAIVICSTMVDTIFHYQEKPKDDRSDETRAHSGVQERWKKQDWMIAFSLLTNGKKIVKIRNRPGQLLCLNGIKAISMMWVILGHGYSLSLNAAISNLLHIREMRDDWMNMFLWNAPLSVDTFLLVGGLVTVYTFLKSKKRFDLPFFIFYYLHRYLRLTPALGVCMLFYANLIKYFGHGPLWAFIDFGLAKSCREKGWWATLLYVSNYVKDGYCVPPTWYLAVDMQLYVLSPLVLIPLTLYPKIGLGLLGMLGIAGVIVPLVIGYVNEFPGMSWTGNEDFSKYYYMATQARFGPYVIGMIAGYIIFTLKHSKKPFVLKPITVCLLWVATLVTLVACTYAGHDLVFAKDVPRWPSAIYLGFDRPGWALALSVLIILCVFDYGGPINFILSLPIFTFLTRLSYSMFLIHYAVIGIRFSSSKNTDQISNINMMHHFWGDFMFTLGLSLILSLVFESPVIILEKYIFKGLKYLMGLGRKQKNATRESHPNHENQVKNPEV